MTPESAHSPAGTVLLVRTPDAEQSLAAGRSYFVGRDPQSDIVVNDSRVSWRHAVIRQDGPNWLLEDVGSTNGTYQGRDRVQRVAISGSCALRLGHPDDGPAMSCSVSGPARPADGGQMAGPRPGGAQPTAYSPAPASPPPNPAVKRVPGDVAGGRGADRRGADGHGGDGQLDGHAPGGYAPAGYGPGGQGAGGYGGVPGGGPGVPGGGLAGGGVPGGGAPPGGPGGPPVPSPRLSVERMPSAVLRLPTTLLRIGRAADNQVVVADLSVSRYHAELRRDPRGGYTIVDLSSHNGTFVNGQRVGSAPVTERDIISIGPSTFRLVGEELQQFIDTGDVSFIAQDLTVTLPSGRVLLDHVSFPLGERSLLGVIGPSGAGKSTLLGALTGMAPATQGTVLYDGRDLYQNFAELRYKIGLVPQENILHNQLSGRRALEYAAELRFPQDTSKAERSHRISEVIDELALTKHAQTKVAAMSGGQQKRVNVALELLTKPTLLFLDEPTSGLDPGLDKKLMQQMSELAHDGHTVIVVTHSVSSLDLCDRLLVLVPGGKIAYFGAPQDGLKHFGAGTWADVFQAFDDHPERDWAGEFRRSAYYQQFVSPGMEGSGALHSGAPRQLAAQAPKTSNTLSQTLTLTRRYSAVISADKGFLWASVLIPLLIAGIVKLLGGSGLVQTAQGNTSATSLLLILALGSCLAGTVNSIREIVKERQIYSRERATGLSAGSYLMSKIIVLSVISAIQSVILVGVGLIGTKLPPHGATSLPPLVELILAMALVSIASMCLGLLLSSVVSTSEQSTLLMFPSVIAQVVVTGGAVPVAGKLGLEQVAWFFPARWGFGAAASTVNLAQITLPAGTAPKMPDPVWAHDARTWFTDMGLQVALAIGFSVITWIRLAKQGPLKRGA
jgi:ABC transport system ATP-binding/permease protein